MRESLVEEPSADLRDLSPGSATTNTVSQPTHRQLPQTKPQTKGTTMTAPAPPRMDDTTAQCRFSGTRPTICDVRFHGGFRGRTGLIAEAVKTALMTRN